jgi:uncharacterized membrane protein
MKESIFNKNWIYFSVVFLIVLYIAFYKENLTNISRVFFAFLILGIIPGYMLSRLFFESLDMLTQMVLGICLSFCIIGIFGYYLGLIGLHLKYFVYVYYIGLFLLVFKKFNYKSNQEQ